MDKWTEKIRNRNNTQEIINKSCDLDPKQKDKSRSCLEHWCLAFLRRYSYSLRAATHIGQKLKECALADYKEFMTYVYSLRANLDKQNINPDFYNMDETPIFLEFFSNKTIEKTVANTVYINTHGGEKMRLTLILCVNSKGDKLPPLLIFKGAKDGKKEKILNNCSDCKNKKIYVLCQENSWADKTIFLYWLENIFFNNTIPYLRLINLYKILILLFLKKKFLFNKYVCIKYIYICF